MMKGALFIAALCILTLAAPTNRDHTHSHSEEEHDHGFWWVFSESNIHVVDPEHNEIVQTIPVDTLMWADVVLTKERKIFINDRTPGNGRVRIFNADTYENLENVDVGENPVHIYYLPWRDEIWTHSDLEGHFDVLESISHDIKHRRLNNTFSNAGHGKLGFSEDLLSNVFGGNVNDHGVYKIDLAQLGNQDYQPQWIPIPGCNGTHGVLYFHSTAHLYLNCLQGTGTFEIDTNGNVIAQHTWDGNLYPSEVDTWMIALDGTTATFAYMDTPNPNVNNPAQATIANASGTPAYLLEADSHPKAFFGTSLDKIEVVDLDSIDGVHQFVTGVGPLCVTCRNRLVDVSNDGSFQGIVVSGAQGDTIQLFDANTLTITGTFSNLGRVDRVLWVPAAEDSSSSASSIIASLSLMMIIFGLLF